MASTKNPVPRANAALNPAPAYRFSPPSEAVGAARLLHDQLARTPLQIRDVLAAFVNEAVDRGMVKARGGCAYADLPGDLAMQDGLMHLLRDGFAQSVALRALGHPLIDTPVQDELLAANIAVEINQVAYGFGASREAYDHVSDTLHAQHHSASGVSEPWWTALRTAFFALPPEKTSEAKVEAVLRMLDVAVADAPKNLKERRPEHMRRAAEFMRTLRMKHWKKEFQPPAAKKGPGMTEWGAARAFASCFDVKMPEERDAMRDWSLVKRDV